MQGDDPQRNTGLSNNISNWAVSKQYDKNCIDIISDDDTSSSESPTSIPSPFARIALAKTAFAEVAKGNANNAYRQIVSDCLDLAEICFDFPKWKQHIDIIKWDKINDLKGLPDTNPLKSTLELFLKSDSEEFHFDRMESISVLTLKTGETIGATSPCTVFFSPENKYKDGAPEFLLSGGHKAFQRIDSNYTGTPLSSRDWDFVKYFWNFCYCVGIDQCVIDYLLKQKEDFDAAKKIEIKNIEDKPSIDGYSTNRVVEILKDSTYCFRDTTGDEIDSDFMLDKQRIIVIPNGGEIFIKSKTTYNLTQHQIWDENKFGNKYYDNVPDYNNRILPTQDNFPCLYISDFLADTIVRMPYKLNSQSFFNGHYENEDESFLLPLTDTFFKFFTIEDLQKNVPGTTKKVFEFVEDLNGIKVILRIPIKNNNFIEYSRFYVERAPDGQELPDLSKNLGLLIEKQFGLGIMPFVKFPDNVTAKEYRVPLLTDESSATTQLSFYQANNLITATSVVRKNLNSAGGNFELKTFAPNDNFDRINVEAGNVSGIIIPLIKAGNSNEEFTFAIDFGTTNTHIAYCTGNNSDPQAFNISPDENKLCRLHIDYRIAGGTGVLFQSAFVHNFMPEMVSYPMRTVFAEKEDIDYNQTLATLLDGNIPFLYEKEEIPKYSKKQTEIKWDSHTKLQTMYLENLFKLLQMKVVANRGNLDKVKIIWSYPASFTPFEHGSVEQTWTTLFTKYFGSDNINDRLFSITESAAPWYCYKASASGQTVSIDVGGGTTDVYVLENEYAKMLLSFKFASNALFGDAYGENCEANGFFQLYYDNFIKVLHSNDLGELEKTLKQIKEQKREKQVQHTPDIIAFLFSLIKNPQVEDNSELDLSKKLLQDGKMKYIFILFYGAIVYYVAKAMKTKGVKRPSTVVFSGNGSKTLNILASSNPTIGKFIQFIFNDIYGEVSNNLLEIYKSTEPKEATSKGSILYCVESPQSQTPDDIEELKCTLLGDDMNSEYKNSETYQKIINNQSIKTAIVNSVVEYIDFIFKIHTNNNSFFTKSLGADQSLIDKVKTFCRNEDCLMESLNKALNKVKDKTETVEETLFFYPLIKTLHDLALKISKNEL